MSSSNRLFVRTPFRIWCCLWRLCSTTRRAPSGPSCCCDLPAPSSLLGLKAALNCCCRFSWRASSESSLAAAEVEEEEDGAAVECDAGLAAPNFSCVATPAPFF